MTLILSIALGLIFALVIGVMALGIVAFARDHGDETLPSANVGADQPLNGVPTTTQSVGEGCLRGVSSALPSDPNLAPHAPASPPNQPNSPNSPNLPQIPHSRPSRPRDSRGRFIKKTPSRP